jgi:hypothetical protein
MAGRLVVTYDMVGCEGRGVIAKGYEVSFFFNILFLEQL